MLNNTGLVFVYGTLKKDNYFRMLIEPFIQESLKANLLHYELHQAIMGIVNFGVEGIYELAGNGLPFIRRSEHHVTRGELLLLNNYDEAIKVINQIERIEQDLYEQISLEVGIDLSSKGIEKYIGRSVVAYALTDKTFAGMNSTSNLVDILSYNSPTLSSDDSKAIAEHYNKHQFGLSIKCPFGMYRRERHPTKILEV